jgi:mannosyltransferase OCH1-like enzyme
MGKLIETLVNLEPKHRIGFKKIFTQQNKRWVLIDDLYEKNVLSNNPKNGGIPKKIHQVWLGGKIPKSYNKLLETWSKYNPHWEFRLWGDDDLSEFGLDKDMDFKKIKNLGSKSDIFRYHILKKYGGLYTDTDFMCVKNLDWLTNFDFVGGGFSVIFDRNNSPEIYNGLFASSPNHPILETCIKNVYQSIEKNGGILNQTGPRFFTECIFEELKEDSKAVVLPMNYFYPFPAVNRFNKNNIERWIVPETFCVHLWYSSWQ